MGTHLGKCVIAHLFQFKKSQSVTKILPEKSHVRYMDCTNGGCIYHCIYSHCKSSSLSFHKEHSNFNQKFILIKSLFWNQNIRLKWYKWTPGHIKGTSKNPVLLSQQRRSKIFSHIWLLNPQFQHFLFGHKMLLYFCDVTKLEIKLKW